MGKLYLHKDGQPPLEKRLPEREDDGRIFTKYPFEDMGIGDSMYVTGKERRKTVGRTATVWGKRNGRRFKRKTDDGGVLITRIA